MIELIALAAVQPGIEDAANPQGRIGTTHRCIDVWYAHEHADGKNCIEIVQRQLLAIAANVSDPARPRRGVLAQYVKSVGRLERGDMRGPGVEQDVDDSARAGADFGDPASRQMVGVKKRAKCVAKSVKVAVEAFIMTRRIAQPLLAKIAHGLVFEGHSRS